jgi:hypothetical protein
MYKKSLYATTIVLTSVSNTYMYFFNKCYCDFNLKPRYCVTYLRNGEASNGETGYNIRAEKIKTILRTPLKNREHVLKSQKKLCERSLVFESMKRVIRKKDFRESMSKFLKSGSLWWQTNLVNFQWCLIHWYLWLDFHGFKRINSIGIHTHFFVNAMCYAMLCAQHKPLRWY